MHTVSYPFSEYVIKLKVIHPIAHLNISVNCYYPWWQLNLTKRCQKTEYNRHWARPSEQLSSITSIWKESICTLLVWTNAKKTAEKQTGPAEMNLTKDSDYTTIKLCCDSLRALKMKIGFFGDPSVSHYHETCPAFYLIVFISFSSSLEIYQKTKKLISVYLKDSCSSKSYELLQHYFGVLLYSK